MRTNRVGWVVVTVLTLGLGLMTGNAAAQSPRIPLPATSLVNPPQTCPVYLIGQVSPGVYNYYCLYYNLSTPCNGSPTPTFLQGNYACPQSCPNCIAQLRVAADSVNTGLPFAGRKKVVEPTHDPRKTGDGAVPDVPAEMLKFSEFLPAEDGELRFYLKDDSGRQYVCYRVRITLEPRGADRAFPLEREIFFGYEMRSDATVPQTVYQAAGMEPVEPGVPIAQARVFRCDLPKSVLRTQYGSGDVKQVLLLQVK